ncbi:MAG: FAD binding domain-containing protein [Candidatus Bathyarchaeia archaeon]|jgi:CO/xanthine dehydrogenase FAD-binding subunit
MRKFDMYVPEDLPDLLHYLNTHQSGAHLIANGSDLISRIQRRQVNPRTLIDLSGLTEFNYVKKVGDLIIIGALTTISDLINSPIIDSRHEVFREVAAKFGGPAIINVATVGGNICAASSSEDLLPVLLVLDAQVRMRSEHGERVMRLEDFLKGKRVTDLKPNEIVVETMFKALDDQTACAFEKIGMRNSLIIAFVNSAVYLRLERKTKRVEDVRIAFNRVGGKIPERSKRTEEKLRGRMLSAQAVEDAAHALRSELKLSSDFRASGEYRTEVAGVLFKRALGRSARMLSGEENFV